MATPSTFVADDTPASFQPDDAPSSFVADEAPTKTAGSFVMSQSQMDSIAEAEQQRRDYGKGMEAGTEFTEALSEGGNPIEFAKNLATFLPHAAGVALEHAGAAALNIPAAIYREATGVTPTVTKIEKDEAGNAVMVSRPAPLPFQPGQPVVEVDRKTMIEPEGNDVIKLVEGLLTPGNIAAFPFASSKSVQAFFLTQTAPAAVKAAEQLVSKNLSPDQRRTAATELLVNSLMSYGLSRSLRANNAPATAAVMEESTKPLNPGGSREALSPELKTIEADNAAKQRQIAEEFKKSLEPETITGAAIQVKGEQSVGVNHAEAVHNYAKERGINPEEVWADTNNLDTGFVTSKGRFVDLKEANRIANKTFSHADELLGTKQSPSTPKEDLTELSQKEQGGEVVANEKEISTVAEKEGVGEATATVQGLGVERVSEATQKPEKLTERLEYQNRGFARAEFMELKKEEISKAETPDQKAALQSEYESYQKRRESEVEVSRSLQAKNNTEAFLKFPNEVIAQLREEGGNSIDLGEMLISRGIAKISKKRIGKGVMSGKGTLAEGTISLFEWTVDIGGKKFVERIGSRNDRYSLNRAESFVASRAASEYASQQSPSTPEVVPPKTAAAENAPAAANVGKELVKDWTSATEEIASPVKEVAGETGTPKDQLVEYHAGLMPPKFADRKMSQLDQATSLHSAKMQKSFDEARLAQREIKTEVPTERRQSAISVWREAKGDIPTLQAWAAAAKGKVFKQAAIDAQSLTPAEQAVAAKVDAAFGVLYQRGLSYDVLKSHREEYVPHVWDVKKPGTGWGGGVLKQRFRFAKARVLDTFFEGDQAGLKPKTLAIGKLLPAYIHEMNKVVADRQLVRDMAGRLASDGRPLVLPRGTAKEVTTGGDTSTLVFPRATKTAKDKAGDEINQSDYRTLEGQPALHDWRWVAKDSGGKPIFMQSDVALHPEALRRLNSMIGQSAIRQWYHEDVGGTAQVPRAIARGLDKAQSAMKREMFGLLAPFHQVQEGTHAIGHAVNPFFGVPKVDLRNPAQLDATKHGLMMLPDRSSSRIYLEGVGTHASLLSQGLRKSKVAEPLADLIDGYQDYLFHQYIPGLKFKTYEAMLQRNTKLYDKELKAGTITESDIKITSAEQANAAYGHLNYALLDRNPTIQHMLQLGMLAPDFLEARARFVGQGFKGLTSKVGHEQIKAIGLLAAIQAGTAFIISTLLDTPYDPQHPFEVIYKGRRYAMRSVPEDIFALIKDTRQFVYSRVNPLTVRGAVQLATGLNYRGEKVTATDTMEELLAGYIPITARAIPGIRSLTETGKHSPVTPLQQLAGSLGLRISRYSPISETYKLAAEWADKEKLDRGKGSYPISKYQQLRYALEDGDMERAQAEYSELRKTMTASKITKGFRESITHPFTGSTDNDKKFAATLTGYDKGLYELALETRKNILTAYSALEK